MLEKLLPSCVKVVESLVDRPDRLFPAEEAAMVVAVDSRRREFTTVRWCARSALAQLGIAPTAVVPGEGGAPMWPSGVVGSMSHCSGYRVSAVALTTCVRSLGVDAEEDAPLPPGVLPAITVPEERAHLQELTRIRPDVYWDRLLFSIKESVYKTWFPLTRRPLDFEDATVTMGAFTNEFRVRLTVAEAELSQADLRSLEGRWSVEDGLILTAIALRGTAPSSVDSSGGVVGPR
jgi:4'-phosphopantetheinyl transferase EntD